VLPLDFAQTQSATDGVAISFDRGGEREPPRIAIQLGPPGTTRATAMPVGVVQLTRYTKGTVGQPGYGALVLVIWGPTQQVAGGTGDQRQIGSRTVTVSPERVSGTRGVAPMDATRASWREASFVVTVLALGVTDTDVDAFIGGLVIQRGPGREYIPPQGPPPTTPDGSIDTSNDPAMTFAEETGWTPVACPSHVKDTIGPENGVCGYVNRADEWINPRMDVVDAYGNLVGHFGGPRGGGFEPLDP
jgi:hypothetical protein